MPTQVTLDVAPRATKGTTAVRRLRTVENVVPGILYGAGQESVSISLPMRSLLKAMQQENFLSQIIELQLNGTAERVVVREVQRHPATENITHIDFLRIREDQEIQVAVPIRFTNEENCVGVRLGGGTITHNMIEVEISCLPRDLPEALEVDMSQLEVGQSIHLSGLNLPTGVTIPALGSGDDSSRDLSVVSVSILRTQADDDEDVDSEQAGIESADGEGLGADDNRPTSDA